MRLEESGLASNRISRFALTFHSRKGLNEIHCQAVHGPKMAETSKSKMNAAVLYGPKDLRIEEVDIPPLNDDEALIKVRVIGICPSDVKIYEGVYKRQFFQYGKESYGLSGHEWCGEVVAIGKSVKDFYLGDRVVPEIITPCGVCKFCRKGLTNLCANKKNIIRGYAEYAKAPARSLFRIPSNVSFEAAAFAEPIAVCLHANELISPRPSDTILIIGGGPIGLIHVQVSKLSGATVIVSEIAEKRLKMAKELGADTVFNPAKEDLTTQVRSLAGGYGADAVIVATGSKTAIESSFKTVSVAGTVILFGGTYPPVNVEIDPNIIHYGEVTVTGSYDHTPAQVERALRLLAKGAIRVEKLISDTFRLAQLKEGFELVESGDALKVNVKP